MTNYERIKNLSLDEMAAEFMIYRNLNNQFQVGRDAFVEWLKAETGNLSLGRLMLALRMSDAKERDVMHGRWIGKPLDNFRKYQVTCSNCKWVGIENYDSYNDPSEFNYCPNCGAKMDGEENEDEVDRR